VFEHGTLAASLFLLGVAVCTYVGRYLGTFTIDFFKDLFKGKSTWAIAGLMFCIYAISGLFWFLSKLRFPGVGRCVTYTVNGGTGYIVRAAYWKARLGKLGRNVLIDPGVHILNPRSVFIDDNTWVDKNVILISGDIAKRGQKFMTKANPSYKGQRGELRIGKRCHLGPNTLVQAHAGVEIGDYCGLASGAKIYSVSHHYQGSERDKTSYKSTPMARPDEQCLIEGPVVLEGNNMIGLNSAILPGATIGRNSWIGVNSCVMKSIPENVIAFGNPARVAKVRQT